MYVPSCPPLCSSNLITLSSSLSVTPATLLTSIEDPKLPGSSAYFSFSGMLYWVPWYTITSNPEEPKVARTGSPKTHKWWWEKLLILVPLVPRRLYSNSCRYRPHDNYWFNVCISSWMATPEVCGCQSQVSTLAVPLIGNFNVLSDQQASKCGVVNDQWSGVHCCIVTKWVPWPKEMLYGMLCWSIRQSVNFSIEVLVQAVQVKKVTSCLE